jgi:hypothetical protein
LPCWCGGKMKGIFFFFFIMRLRPSLLCGCAYYHRTCFLSLRIIKLFVRIAFLLLLFFHCSILLLFSRNESGVPWGAFWTEFFLN